MVSSRPETQRAISREGLEAAPATVLKDDGPGRPRVVRYDLSEGPVVLKEWPPGKGVLARWWAERVMGREARNYRRLEGVVGVPRLLTRLGEFAFVVEFVEGLPMRRQLEPVRLRAGLDSLQRTLEALHARRFAHLDLHQRRNILVSESGEVNIIDLAQGVDCSKNWFRRLLFPCFARFDRNAVLKFRARYAPDTIDPAQRDRIVARYGIRHRRPVLVSVRRLFDWLFVRGG